MTNLEHVSLIGWNGKRNLGDDAMTAVIINYISQESRNSACFHLLADQSFLAYYTEVETCIQGFQNYNRFQKIPYIRRWLNPLLFDKRLANSAPTLLIGGGSIFHSVARSQRLLKTILTTRSAHNKTFIGAIGVSLGPFKNDRETLACKKVLQQLDFIALRDQRSWKLFQSLDVQIPAVRAMDIALLLPELQPNQTRGHLKSASSIGIALRQGQTPAQLIDALAISLNEMLEKKKDLTIELLNFSDVDEPASAKLAERLRHPERIKHMPYSDRPSDMYERISNCSIVLASRLHAAVLSYAVETPFAVLAYHPKCTDFSQEVGLDPDWIWPVQSLEAEMLTQRLTAAFFQGHFPTVQRPLADAKQEAKRSFQFLDALRPEAIAQ